MYEIAISWEPLRIHCCNTCNRNFFCLQSSALAGIEKSRGFPGTFGFPLVHWYWYLRFGGCAFYLVAKRFLCGTDSFWFVSWIQTKGLLKNAPIMLCEFIMLRCVPNDQHSWPILTMRAADSFFSPMGFRTLRLPTSARFQAQGTA